MTIGCGSGSESKLTSCGSFALNYLPHQCLLSFCWASQRSFKLYQPPVKQIAINRILPIPKTKQTRLASVSLPSSFNECSIANIHSFPSYPDVISHGKELNCMEMLGNLTRRRGCRSRSPSVGRSLLVGGQWSVNENIPVGEHLKSIFYFNRKISVIVGWSCCWMTVAGWLAGEIDEWRLCEFCTLVLLSLHHCLWGRVDFVGPWNEFVFVKSVKERKLGVASARVSKRWKMIVSLIGVSWILLKY